VPSATLQMILTVGEIDCREGLLVAVERDAYGSVQEGVRETLRGIEPVLAHLTKKKRCRVRSAPLSRLIE
jgi:hypothetical protein